MLLFVLLPNFAHFESLTLALKSGLNVFAEKPMAMNGIECELMLSKRYENISLVGYCRRFNGNL
jgi:predicted dehydrogenase